MSKGFILLFKERKHFHFGDLITWKKYAVSLSLYELCHRQGAEERSFLFRLNWKSPRQGLQTSSCDNEKMTLARETRRIVNASVLELFNSSENLFLTHWPCMLHHMTCCLFKGPTWCQMKWKKSIYLFFSFTSSTCLRLLAQCGFPRCLRDVTKGGTGLLIRPQLQKRLMCFACFF